MEVTSAVPLPVPGMFKAKRTVAIPIFLFIAYFENTPVEVETRIIESGKIRLSYMIKYHAG